MFATQLTRFTDRPNRSPIGFTGPIESTKPNPRSAETASYGREREGPEVDSPFRQANERFRRQQGRSAASKEQPAGP